MIRKSLLMVFLVGGTYFLQAQQSPIGQTFEEVQRMMLRGMFGDTAVELRPGQGQRFQFGPDSTSFFYFRMDTTLRGGVMSDFFRVDPFSDHLKEGETDDFWGFGQMMREMQEMQRRMFGGVPGEAPDSGDEEVLPEERIRKREEVPLKPSVPPTTPPVQSKIKTIRI